MDRVDRRIALAQLLSDVAPRLFERLAELRALLFFLDLLELFHDVVACDLRALDDRRSLGARLFELAVGYLLLVLSLVRLELCAHFLSLGAVLVHLETARLKACDHVLELLVLGADEFLRPVHDLVGQTEL